MKKILLTAVLFTAAIITGHAQDVQPKEEGEGQKRIEAMYVAYVTKELNLTAEEAQKFWPVHTQFTNEIKGVKQDQPELDKQQAVLNIKKKYQDKFTGILGNKRCEHFFRLRDNFNKKLLDKLRKQRQERRPQIRRGI